MTNWRVQLASRGFLLVMALGWVAIGLASLEYFEPDSVAPFVAERLPVRFESLWLGALQWHVASAIVIFPLCLVLGTPWLQRRPVWHRSLGRVTGALVVAVLVPSGIVLSFEAKGGALVTVGFFLSAAVVLVAMVSGVASARRRDFLAHKRHMLHVTAQMSVAVTSRGLLRGFDMAGLEPEVAYTVALWIPVVASALAAEWLAGRRAFPSFAFTPPVPRSLS